MIHQKDVGIPCGCLVDCDIAENGTMTSVVITYMCYEHQDKLLVNTARKLGQNKFQEAIDKALKEMGS